MKNELPQNHIYKARELEAEKRAERARERGVHFNPPKPKIKGETKGESEPT